MRAGPLDRRIRIERLSTATAASGGVEDSWTPDGTEIWAQYVTRGGRERFVAGQIETVGDAVFRVRADEAGAVTEKDRVRYGAALFDIVAVVELGRNDGLELVCQRAMSAGEP